MAKLKAYYFTLLQIMPRKTLILLVSGAGVILIAVFVVWLFLDVDRLLAALIVFGFGSMALFIGFVVFVELVQVFDKLLPTDPRKKKDDD